MKAADLLPLAIDWLAEQYPGAVIVPELSIGTWGGALLDVAAITPTEIIGVEIKGEGDSPARLPLQASLYSKAATRMLFLACPALEERCFKHLPDAWGRLSVRDGRLECRVREGRKWYLENPDQARHMPAAWAGDPRADRLCTAPAQLLQCLWRDELDAIARLCGVMTGKVDVETLRWKISEVVPLERLRLETCDALRRRKWINKTVHRAPEKAKAA
jgi:hypothetical protein